MESLLNGIDVNLHDILIFIDSDNQGTTEMLVSFKPLFPNLTIIKNNGDSIGYAGNINWAIKYSKTKWISFLQSDCIVCLQYDQKLWNHLKDNQVLCSLRCEPPLHAQIDNEVTLVRNFGLTPEEFQYEDFLKFAECNKDSIKLTNFFFMPFTMNKSIWIDHDVSFIKSREDSDIALRFALKGVEMKQTWEAMVYHFSGTSSRGIKWWEAENKEKEIIRQKNDRIEFDRFIKKWGFFVHPSSPKDVEHLIKTHPEILNKIHVTNPPIDETKLTFL